VPVPERFFYGGQAVIEGVLMRGRTTYALAVRQPNGELLVKAEPLRMAIYTHPLWKLPFLRGLAGLWEMLHLGMKCLIFSANVQAAGEDIQITPKQISATVAASVVIGIGFFLGLPLLLAGLIHRGHSNAVQFNLIEGFIRLGLLFAYLFLIAQIPDIRRVFQYHGAEHKTINAYEADLPLDVEHVQSQSTLHPRCGTGFLLAVMLFSVFVFSLLGKPSIVGLVGSRLLLIPVIASLAYEFIRFAGRHRNHPIVKVVLVPFLLTQKLTTRQPDDRQVEVALAAFAAARREETEAAA
jgi:uncharacterized protein YqhQ